MTCRLSPQMPRPKITSCSSTRLEFSESCLNDSRPLDQEPGISFDKLLKHVASGGVNPEMVSSLASRLSRLDKQLGPEERRKIKEAADGGSLHDIAHAIVDALELTAKLNMHGRSSTSLLLSSPRKPKSRRQQPS